MIQVLNLNYSELVAERSTLIEYLDGEIEQGAPFSELIEGFCDLSVDGARVSFANVAIQYLRRQAGLA